MYTYVCYNVCIYIFYVCEYTEYIKCIISILTLVAQMVQNLLAMWETWVQSLGWEDHPKKEMATLSSILAWKTLWTEEPGGLQSMGSQRVKHD